GWSRGLPVRNSPSESPTSLNGWPSNHVVRRAERARGRNRCPRAIPPAETMDREDDTKSATPILPSSPVPEREAEHRRRGRGRMLCETPCEIRGKRQSILRRSGGPLLLSRSPRGARDWHRSPPTLRPWVGRQALTRCRNHGRRVAG